MIHGSVVVRGVSSGPGSTTQPLVRDDLSHCATFYALFFLDADLRLVSAASYGMLVPHSQSQKVNVEACREKKEKKKKKTGRVSHRLSSQAASNTLP